MRIRNFARSLALGASVLALASCGDNSSSSSSSPRPLGQEELENTVLMYLAQPHFSGSDLAEKVTGTQVELERLNLSEGMVYFSIPSESFVRGETLESLTENPSNVEFAQLEGGRLVLGTYAYRAPGRFFFRLPSEEFHVDPGRTIEFPFTDATYSMNLEELTRFIRNTSVYRGSIWAEGSDSNGRQYVFANHAPFVARPGEPSLQRLVSTLTADVESDEEVAQILLDFVTREIEYGGGDDIGGAEVLKRPNEVLMTGTSDCSGLAILYASLLEQTDVDYRIVYSMPNSLGAGHISTLVRGDFPNRNGLSFTINGDSYVIAETTVDGFRIGETRLRGGFGIDYIQDPGEDAPIIDAKTGRELEFR
jgi:transglutaminase-like putative cysteine protease